MPLLPVLASQAGEAYRKGVYGECLEVLAQLQDEVPDGDPKLQHNLTLAEFAKENCKNPKLVMKRLTEILQQAGFKSKREKRTRRLVSAADTKEKSDSDHPVLTKPGIALVLYNLAALLHQSRHTSATMSHLETIFENMDDLDDLLVARSCLLLLELYSTVLRGCACLQGQRAVYLERASQVIEHCMARRSLDHRVGGGTGTVGGKSGGSKGGSNNGKEGTSVLSRQYRLRLHVAMSKVYMAVEDTRKAKRSLAAVGTLLEPPSQSSQSAAKSDLTGAAASEDWNDRTSDFSFCLQMLRANHEYLKHEYRKSVKLLHVFNPTGPLQALFFNNMGCVHFKLKKFTSAAFYFTRALQVSAAQKQKGVGNESEKRVVPAHNQRTALGNHGEISYNNGMALLAAHDYVSAFKCFQKAIFVFSSWPCLWFRMADCCIKAHNERTKPEPLVKAALGSGRLHRFLLSSATLPDARSSEAAAALARSALERESDDAANEEASDGGGDGGDGMAVDGSGANGAGTNGSDSGGNGNSRRVKAVSAADAKVMRFMTLEHAQQYLQNSLVLIQRYAAEDGHVGNGNNGGGSSGSGGGSGGGAESPKGKGANAGNANKGPSSLSRVMQAVLLNMSYVSLCLNNPVQAVTQAKRLLAMPDCDSATAEQARLYCAEAQCQLSRVSDAQQTIRESSAMSGSSPANTEERVATLIALANVHVLQEQLDEAEAAVRQAMKWNPMLPEGIRLMVYINLKRGRTSHVLQLIKTHEMPVD